MLRRLLPVLALACAAASVFAFDACTTGDNGTAGADASADGAEGTDASVADGSVGVDATVPDAGPDAPAVTDASNDATVPDASDADVADATPDQQSTTPDASADAADAGDAAPAACADGGPPPCVIVLAEGQTTPLGIAVDSNNVYWTTFGAALYDAGAVMSTPIGGGAITTVATSESRPSYLAHDTTTLYWPVEFDNVIKEAPLDGGAPTTFLANQSTPDGIAVDGTNVYWTVLGGDVYQAPKATASPVTLIASGVGNPQGPFVHGGFVYFSDFNGGFVEKMPIGGGGLDAGSPILVASGQDHPGFITFDATNLYWYNGGDNGTTTNGSIMTLPIDDTDGGAPVALVPNIGFGENVLIDGDTLYWADATNIMRMTLPAGTPTTFVAGAHVAVMTQDATNLYWTGGTTVSQVAK